MQHRRCLGNIVYTMLAVFYDGRLHAIAGTHPTTLMDVRVLSHRRYIICNLFWGQYRRECSLLCVIPRLNCLESNFKNKSKNKNRLKWLTDIAT